MDSRQIQDGGGVTGSIAFDEVGDVPDAQVYVTVVRNGRIELAGEQ